MDSGSGSSGDTYKSGTLLRCTTTSSFPLTWSSSPQGTIIIIIIIVMIIIMYVTFEPGCINTLVS